MMSFLTRVNYSFDDRYTLTGSFRADGSSRFGIDSRWGYFPSVSAGLDALERTLPQGCAQGRGFDPSARQLG